MEDNKMYNFNINNSDGTQGRVTDARIWTLALVQLAEAKPWSHHSLSMVCQSPDPTLSKVEKRCWRNTCINTRLRKEIHTKLLNLIYVSCANEQF